MINNNLLKACILYKTLIITLLYTEKKWRQIILLEIIRKSYYDFLISYNNVSQALSYFKY